MKKDIISSLCKFKEGDLIKKKDYIAIVDKVYNSKFPNDLYRVVAVRRPFKVKFIFVKETYELPLKWEDIASLAGIGGSQNVYPCSMKTVLDLLESVVQSFDMKKYPKWFRDGYLRERFVAMLQDG